MRAQTKRNSYMPLQAVCTEILITLRPTIMEAESNMLGTLDLYSRLKSVTEIATCLVLGRVSIMLSTWNCRRRPRFSTIIGFIVDDYDLILSLNNIVIAQQQCNKKLKYLQSHIVSEEPEVAFSPKFLKYR